MCDFLFYITKRIGFCATPPPTLAEQTHARGGIKPRFVMGCRAPSLSKSPAAKGGRPEARTKSNQVTQLVAGSVATQLRPYPRLLRATPRRP